MTCLLLCSLLWVVSAQMAMASAITVMRPGDRGSAVALLQKELQKKGYYTYPEITGNYGEETEKAVQKFQGTQKLGRDGVAGVYTLRALFGREMEGKLSGVTITPGEHPKVAEEPPTIASRHAPLGVQAPSFRVILRLGARDDEVLVAQKRLSALGYLAASDTTGYFGEQTLQAVMDFQTGCKLLVDGEIGEQTWGMLFVDDAPTYTQVEQRVLEAHALFEEKDHIGGVPAKAEQLIAFAKQFLGRPYVYGTAGPNTFDCSGFTKYVYAKFGYTLPHTSRLQGKNYGRRIESIENLQTGDLIFFDSEVGNNLAYDHVGIYLKDGEFIHAASGSAKKVCISSLKGGYYERVFAGGRRLL